MKLKSPFLFGLGGLVAATAVRQWMSTLDYRIAYYDPRVDPLHPACPGHMVFVFWHEYILGPLPVRGHAGMTMLLSRHTDAEILGRAARHLGFECVRGSTNKGGLTALREMVDHGRRRHLTITPDGPRGPRRTMAQGPIYLASRLGLPLVCLGVGYDRPWRARSWDRFAVPRPYSRARGVVGPPWYLPPDLDRDGLEHYRREAERLLNRMTCEAEAWAESGTRKVNELPVRTRAAEPFLLPLRSPVPVGPPMELPAALPRAA